MKLNCQRCGREWDYKGKSEWFTSCPTCRTSIKVKKPIIQIKKEWKYKGHITPKEYPQYTSCPRCKTSVIIKEEKNGTKSE